jgi:hypothetical protein
MTVAVIKKRKSVGIDLTLRIVSRGGRLSRKGSFIVEVDAVEAEQKARFGLSRIRRCGRGGSMA